MKLDATTLQSANERIKYTKLKTKDGYKDYAEVKERIKAFRDYFPEYTIATQIITLENNTATIKATIMDPGGRVIATGHAQEEKGKGLVNSTSHVENCETSAIGRALGNFGLGIDAAFASADEVVNAIKQEQEDLANVRANPDAPISKRQHDSVINKCAEDGVSIEDICDIIGIESLETMTIPQYWALTQKWSETVEKIKAMKRLMK